jgi:hypothetical protein
MQETDLTVKIGSGDAVKEFLCHSAILSLASTKLDSLISKASGELLLPNLNPEHWCLFYKCISPENNGECLAEYDHSTNNFERIKYLVPFFKEYDMYAYLDFPIEVLLDVIDLQRYAGDEEDEFLEDSLKAMLDILQLAVGHN